MELPELGVWVPLTPQKPCSESINGENNCKDSLLLNSMDSVDSKGDLYRGKVEALASSNGVEIKFGVEAGERRCTEKERQRVLDFEDEEINLHCTKNLQHVQRNLASPSVSTPFPSEKQNTRKRHNDGLDLNKKPKQNPKVKKHRPKIAADRWQPRTTPKSQTPRRSTPRNLKPSTPKNANLLRKRYLGKSSNSKGLISTSGNVKGETVSESSTSIAVSCKRSLNFECEAVDHCDDNTDLNMCPDFDTEKRERGEKCDKRYYYQYHRQYKSVGRSSSKTNIGINIGVEECTNSSSNTDIKQLMVVIPHEMKKQSVVDINDPHGNSKTGIMQFYRRIFRVDQCQQNSRKSGPNFPKIWKKPRMRRQKATTFLTIWSIIEGARGGSKGNAQINWKIVRKGLRSLRKSKYQRPSSICSDFQIEKALLTMVMPTKEQTRAAIADPESFKCVMGLRPVAKSRKKRSKGFIPRSIRNPSFVNYNFSQLPPLYLLKYLGGASYGRKVRESQTLEEVQLSESENYHSWRRNTSTFCNDDIVAYDTGMEGGHHLKETQRTHTLEEVPLEECENYLNCSLNTPSFFLDDAEAHSSERHQPDNNCLDVVVYRDENYPPMHKAVMVTSKSSNYAFVRELLNLIVKLKRLNIDDECNEFLEQDQKFHAGTLVKIGHSRKRKVPPKVALDPETLRVFKLLMDNDGGDSEDTDEDKKEWWRKEREIFRGRTNSFIARMHDMQGDRRFSKWKGSVVDSVVGVYLTQNVTDVLSSSAFINLAAKYPVKPRSKEIVENVGFTCSQESVGSNTGADTQGVSNKCTDIKGEGNIDGVKCEKPYSYAFPIQDIEGLAHDMDLKRNNKLDTGASSTSFRNLLELEQLGFLQQFYGAENDLLSSNVNLDLKLITAESSTQTSLSNAPYDQKVDPLGISGEGDMECVENKSESIGSLELSGSQITTYNKVQAGEQEPIPFELACSLEPEFVKKDLNLRNNDNVSKKSTTKNSSSKGEKKKKTRTDWEELRRSYCNHNERRKDDDTMDAVNWEAVRNASVEEVAEAIAKRGMNNVLAARIKDCLERIVKDHGNIDLEWLRDIPPDDAKDFLLSIEGLGLKSVECIRLLTLHHRAFPVDTNVGRVAVRLGWVPLAPLPEGEKLHNLNQYPLQDKIQMYLFPRLCTFDQETLYELHYQLITFGKVFCTKINPNCKACPMKGECKHYASSIASSQLALPWFKEKSFVASNMSAAASDQNRSMSISPPPESLYEVKFSDKADPNPSEINVFDSTYRTQNCEPIVEVPESPRPESVEPPELRDIEDYYNDSDDEIPTIRLNEEELMRNLQNILETEYMLQGGDIADALTALAKEAASVHPPKLKFIEKLRTVHQVIELPDFHPLLEEFEERVAGDPCPYLLAIWPTGVISESFQQHSSGGDPLESGMCNEIVIHPSCRTNQGETIKGTILIPCRTAMRGRFPLNGTYFQVNEVFADYESSEHPVDVPKVWICNLPKRSLHCGVAASGIFRGAIMEEIQYCFWRGYICVRAFHRNQRITSQLNARFHFSASAAGKTRAAQ